MSEPEQRADLSLWVSTEVHRNLVDLGFDGSTLCDYRIVDHQGLGAFISGERHDVRRYAAVLVVFGPFYIRAPGVRKLVGFAQSWIIYPQTDAYALLAWPRRWLTRFKFWLQGWAFRNADQLIVELDHVRDRLISDGIAGKRPVAVIHNCVGSVFLSEGARTVAPLVPRGKGLTLGFLGTCIRTRRSWRRSGGCCVCDSASLHTYSSPSPMRSGNNAMIPSGTKSRTSAWCQSPSVLRTTAASMPLSSPACSNVFRRRPWRRWRWRCLFLHQIGAL